MSEIVYRSMQIRSSEDGRTLEGICAPYNARAQIDADTWEIFAPGVFAGSEGVRLRFEHNATVGVVTLEETEAGLAIRAKVSNTTAGNDLLELVRDGAISSLSVGFIPDQFTMDKDGTVTHTRAVLKEVSAVTFPAHPGAKILALRSEQMNTQVQMEEGASEMSTEDLKTMAADITEVRTATEDLARKVAAMPTMETRAEGPLGSEFRSAGHFLKALVDNDERATSLMTRAHAGTNMADVAKKDGWLADAIKIADQNSILVNAFRRAELPEGGMTAEYLKMGNSTIQVQKQAAEGDVLAFGKLDLSVGSVGFDTYGGYSTLSFQAIRRSSIDVLNMTYSLLNAQAAIRSNAAAIATWQAATTLTQTTATGNFDGYVDSVLAATVQLKQQGIGMPGEFLLMSLDVWTKLSKIKDTNVRLLTLPGVSYGDAYSTGGSLSVPGLGGGNGGTMLGYPVVVESGLAANSLYLCNSNAMVVLGDRNPVRLGPDADITRLISEVSVYFLQGQVVQFPNAAVKLSVPA